MFVKSDIGEAMDLIRSYFDKMSFDIQEGKEGFEVRTGIDAAVAGGDEHGM